MRTLPWIATLVAAGLATSLGCGSDPDSANLADASVAPDAPAALGPCPAQTLCLKPFLVTPAKPVTAGRLTVVWFQLMDIGGTMATELAYDVPFVPGKERYDLPLAQIKAPVIDRVLMCQWENNVCLKTANPPPIGFGLPLVLDDTNANGRIDPAEITLYGNHGVGMAYLAWSAAAHPAGDPALTYGSGVTTYLGDIFSQRIAAGVHAYPLVTGSGFDQRLGAPDAASGADLALCPSQGSSCQVAPPRLVGTTNPR